ncbi:hypothetical protein G6F35_018508 [Rhizopus arrhizus]|nr:hypothetical protein G6F35_018508 [Rhizopus arrhizus]
MASAARVAVAQVREVVELGTLDPETVVTPGIFVQRIAARVAQDIPEGAYVNLGIGLPTLVATHVQIGRAPV